jgi:acetoin utilization protein AcuB
MKFAVPKLIKNDTVMRTAEIVSKRMLELRPQDTIDLALRMMDDLKLQHLPVVDDGHLVGIVKEDELLNFDASLTIESANASITLVELQEDAPYLDALKMFTLTRLTVLPVNGVDGYVGSILWEDILDCFAQLSGAKETGAMLIIEMRARDYSLAQLAQIIEGNDAKILSVELRQYPESQMLDVEVKLNTTNVGGVLQTLHRYDYFVRKVYHQQDLGDDIMQKRYEELMNYINL